MPEPFRDRALDGFTIRWAGFQCVHPMCDVRVHTIGLLGFDFDGMDRWVPVTELVDVEVSVAEDVILETVAEDESAVGAWRLVAAAFGLPWHVLDLEQVSRCSAACWGL